MTTVQSDTRTKQISVRIVLIQVLLEIRVTYSKQVFHRSMYSVYVFPCTDVTCSRVLTSGVPVYSRHVFPCTHVTCFRVLTSRVPVYSRHVFPCTHVTCSRVLTYIQRARAVSQPRLWSNRSLLAAGSESSRAPRRRRSPSGRILSVTRPRPGTAQSVNSPRCQDIPLH